MGVAKIYRKGRKLSKIAAIKRILSGEYIMMGDKPMHPGWMRGMTLGTIYLQAHKGRLFAAVRNEK